MQKKSLMCLLIMHITLCNIWAQENYSITGIVTNEQGKPLSGANVVINGTNHGTVTDEQGRFQITNVSKGSHIFVASYIGYLNVSRQVFVDAKKVVDFSLQKKQSELQEIVVQEESIHHTEESLKVMAPLKDIPITTSTVSRSLLDQRQVWNLNEAVKYTTGISPSLNYGGFQTFTMRGFGGPVIMVDGARDERMNFSNSAPVTSLASVEKIEYLKGPAAILYGHSAVGGILNIVRKKPSETFTANMTATYGSWNTKEVNAGAGGAINSKLNYRFDIGLSDRDGWRDNGDKTANAYLALDYHLNTNNTIEFRVGANDDFYGTETGIPSVQNDIFDTANDKLIYTKGDFPKGYNREQRYNDPSDFLDHENYNLSARYIHSFSPTSKLKFQADYAHDIIDYFSTEYLPFLTSDDPIYDTYYLSGDSKKYICLDSLKRAFPLRFSHHTNTYQNYLDYSFQVNTGSVEHKILTGYYLINIDRTTYKGYNVGEDVYGDGLFANIAYENPILNQGDLHTKFSAASIYNELLNSFYAQDLLNISNKLKGLLGIRADIYHMTYQSASVDEGTHTYDHSDKTKQNEFALTYRAGLVYQPIEDLSLYSSYATYFRPNRKSYNPNYIYVDKDGNTFKPEDGEPFFEPESGYQLEGGLKYNYNTKLQLNASVFYIQKNDIVESLGKTEDGTHIYGQVGAVDSKGFDVEIIAKPLTGMQINVGYEKTTAKYKEFSSNNYGENSKEGNYLRMVPENRFFSWLHYEFQNGIAKNFNVGLGYEYNDKKYLNTANTYWTPAYSLLDANIGYTFDKAFLKFGVNNITDEEYFTGAVYSSQMIPGYGKNYRLTVGFRL